MPDEDTENNEPQAANSAESPSAFDAVGAAAEFAAAMAEEPAAPKDAEVVPGAPDKYSALLEEEVEDLKGLLAQKEQALAAAEAKAAAATAELDRARIRIEGRAKTAMERKRRSVLASFLDVVDALDRAATELSNAGVAAAVAQGVEGVRSEMHNVLRQHGATHRPAMGEPFDPAYHEAIATVPATPEAPAGTITSVLSEGYDLGEETLRAARVVVAKD